MKIYKCQDNYYVKKEYFDDEIEMLNYNNIIFYRDDNITNGMKYDFTNCEIIEVPYTIKINDKEFFVDCDEELDFSLVTCYYTYNKYDFIKYLFEKEYINELLNIEIYKDDKLIETIDKNSHPEFFI